MTNKQIEALDFVEQLNIVNNFELYVKARVTQYRTAIGLPNISENDLINHLVELKRDKEVKVIRTLVATRELIKYKQWVDKVGLK